MASLYKERSKCLVKLPTMQYTVTDTGKEDGEKGVTQGGESWGRQGGGEGGVEKQGNSMTESKEQRGGVETEKG